MPGRCIDLKKLDTELKHKGAVLRLLWAGCRTTTPDNLGNGQLCKTFADFKGILELRMRQNHKASEKHFVDYAGLNVSLIHRIKASRTTN